MPVPARRSTMYSFCLRKIPCIQTYLSKWLYNFIRFCLSLQERWMIFTEQLQDLWGLIEGKPSELTRRVDGSHELRTGKFFYYLWCY
ncbi:hypothetical protein ABKV19_025462 [Rosa sericea]